MRIHALLLTDSLLSGGKERQIVELLKGLQTRDEILADLVVMNTRVHFTEAEALRVRQHFLIRESKYDWRIFPRLSALCKELKPNLIHSWDMLTTYYAFPVAAVQGIPFINGMVREAPDRLPFFSKRRFVAKASYPFSRCVVGNSEAGLKAYGVPEGKRRCIYNGFDEKRVAHLPTAPEVRKEIGIVTPFVVGMVATFSHFKDYDTFVLGAREILKRRSDVTFIAVGDGPTRERIEASIEPEFKSFFKFVGRRTDVERIVSVFSVGVLLSFSEATSNALMEYMALGKPIVATNRGGAPELLPDKTLGILIEPRDVTGFVSAVTRLLDNETERNALGENGQRRLHDKFGLDRMVGQYVELYQEIAETKG